MSARSYVIGLPVEITVHDDGRVTYAIDTAEAYEIAEDEDALEAYGEAQVLADAEEIRLEHHDRFDEYYSRAEPRGMFPQPKLSA